MANEWVKVELYGANNDGEPRRYTIAATESVSIGTLMALKTPRAASGATNLTQDLCYAGVAAEEHITGEGTAISVWTQGIFRAVCSGAVSLGSLVTGDANYVRTVVGGPISTASAALVLGYALETGADLGTISVRLDR